MPGKPRGGIWYGAIRGIMLFRIVFELIGMAAGPQLDGFSRAETAAMLPLYPACFRVLCLLCAVASVGMYLNMRRHDARMTAWWKTLWGLTLVRILSKTVSYGAVYGFRFSAGMAVRIIGSLLAWSFFYGLTLVYLKKAGSPDSHQENRNCRKVPSETKNTSENASEMTINGFTYTVYEDPVENDETFPEYMSVPLENLEERENGCCSFCEEERRNGRKYCGYCGRMLSTGGTVPQKEAKNKARRKRRLIRAGVFAVALVFLPVLAFLFFQFAADRLPERNSADVQEEPKGRYYVMDSGKNYHLEDCIVLEGEKSLKYYETESAAKQDGYTPCACILRRTESSHATE